MANKLISEIGLPKSIANIFAARNIVTAKDALSLTEFELMELLDVGLAEVTSAVMYISSIVCPPYQSALSLMEQRVQNEHLAGHLPTGLKGLDEALCGGIPFGVLTELVGPPGIGKSQFCIKLSLLASLPSTYGGLDGRVIYIDVESKFRSRRLIEIGSKSFPEIFLMNGMAQKISGRILIWRPESLSEFTERLQQIKVSFDKNEVKLLVIDSMAALVSGAETEETKNDTARYDSHLVAALGIHWAHAVTIRLVLEAKSGQRFIKVSKSPISPPLAFPFDITASGMSLLSDDGIKLTGPDINAIHSQGHSDIINFIGESLH